MTRVFAIAIFLVAMSAWGQRDAPETKPNVVLIVCDDLNDWVGVLGGHPQAYTPNIDAFAASAVTFQNAACTTPVCAPSRSSFLTGIEPYTSGNLFWRPWFENEILANSKTVMRHFRDNGYRAVGIGKLMHHQQWSEWDEMPYDADYGPLAFEAGEPVAHPSVAEPFASIGAIDGSFGPIDESCEWVFGRQRWKDGVGTRVPFEVGQPTPDERAAQWAADRIRRFAEEGPAEPFFMGVGFIRPHTPMHVPPEFFERFPLEDVELAPILLADEDDTHYRDHFQPSVKGLRYHRTISEAYGSREAGLREFTRAYLASVAFVDAQIGVVLDAVAASPVADNTVVIITSDHGFGIGEKAYLFKNSLWEESSRVPMFIRAPGVSSAGAHVYSPVSLIDLYPTLVDLCDLSGDTRISDRGRPLDGFSLRPLLEVPAAEAWDGPEASITMLHADEDAARELPPGAYDDPAMQHWSLRSRDWRYIRYNDGSEELYDHRVDPHEWHNVSAAPMHESTIARFRAMLSERVGVNTDQ